MPSLRTATTRLIGRSTALTLTLSVLAAGVLPVVSYELVPGEASPRAAVVAVFVAALLSLAVGISTARRYRSALTEAAAHLRHIAHGAYHHALPDSNMHEFRELTASMEYMRERLKETTDRLVHRAFHDPLTGLPNRAFFMNELQSSLEKHAAEHDYVAVLFFDLDRFKVLNDTLGHGAGDRLLILVTRRLSKLANDGGVFARLAGDEFVFLVVGPHAESRACSIAERINSCFEQPFTIDDHEVYVSASVGIASARSGEPSPIDLLRWADIAVYRAKENTRALYVCYDPSVDEMPLDRIDLESALRRAIAREQLLLHYQPEYDLRTGEIVGMEALLRWDHPSRGVMTPSEFIALAEETGEIHNLGQWVLGEACRKAASLNADRVGRGELPLTIAVNLSARELRREGIAEQVAHTLRETGLTPHHLRLEITESVLMDDVPATTRVLTGLKHLGVQVAIDDFGTGYSSLSYLQRLPVDVLKVDQSFVGTLGRDPRSLPIVAAIVQLGRALEMTVTAEGIETREQLQLLLRAGCASGQGFFLSEGVDEDGLARLFERVDLARDIVA